MKSLLVASLVFVSACTGATPAKQPTGPADDIESLVSQSNKAEFDVSYNFTQTGPLVPAAVIVLQWVRSPVGELRKVSLKTPAGAGLFEQIQWFVRNAEGKFVCSNAYVRRAIKCMASEGPVGKFGYEAVDSAFKAVTSAKSLLPNAKESGENRRIAGASTKCFTAKQSDAEVLDAAPTVKGVTPTPRLIDENDYKSEFCFSSAGTLLYAKRSPTSQTTRSWTLEATKYSTRVDASLLQLPATVTDVSKLIPTPSPTPRN